MIDAWFKESEKIAKAPPFADRVPFRTLESAVITAMFAAKPVGHNKHSWAKKEPYHGQEATYWIS